VTVETALAGGCRDLGFFECFPLLAMSIDGEMLLCIHLKGEGKVVRILGTSSLVYCKLRVTWPACLSLLSAVD
jgi:hypothetical protein